MKESVGAQLARSDIKSPPMLTVSHRRATPAGATRTRYAYSSDIFTTHGVCPMGLTSCQAPCGQLLGFVQNGHDAGEGRRTSGDLKVARELELLQRTSTFF